jgi:hypothetical protein
MEREGTRRLADIGFRTELCVCERARTTEEAAASPADRGFSGDRTPYVQSSLRPSLKSCRCRWISRGAVGYAIKPSAATMWPRKS